MNTDLADVKFLLDKYHSHFWSSAGQLSKVWAFYFAISAGVIGYAISAEVDPSLRRGLLGFGTLISSFVCITWAVWCYGLYGDVQLIDRLSQCLGKPVYERFDLHQHFTLWRRLLLGVTAASVVSSAAITFALFGLWVGA